MILQYEIISTNHGHFNVSKTLGLRGTKSVSFILQTISMISVVPTKERIQLTLSSFLYYCYYYLQSLQNSWLDCLKRLSCMSLTINWVWSGLCLPSIIITLPSYKLRGEKSQKWPSINLTTHNFTKWQNICKIGDSTHSQPFDDWRQSHLEPSKTHHCKNSLLPPHTWFQNVHSDKTTRLDRSWLEAKCPFSFMWWFKMI